MTRISIERATRDDLPLFQRMEEEAGTSRFILPYSLEEHHARFSDPGIVYLRILSNDEVRGFFILALEADNESVEFRRIVVSKKGVGIGQTAIRLLEDFCRIELVRSRIWLDVFEDNLRARHVYEKLGYIPFDRKDFEGRTLLVYEKQLQGKVKQKKGEVASEKK